VALLQAINDQRATLIVYALKATDAVAHVDVAVAGGRASLISGLLIDFYAPARRQQQQQQTIIIINIINRNIKNILNR